MKYFLGIDQSYTCTGVCLTDENSCIIDSMVIPVSNDFFKFYKDNEIMDLEATIAFKTGLVDSQCNPMKKKSEFTKDELETLKVSQSKRIYYICVKIEQFILKNDIAYSDIRSGLENISYGSSGAIVDLARLLGGIEHHLQMLGVKHILFPPTQIKSFAGKGNYSKDEMIAAVPQDDINILKMNLALDRKGNHIGLNDVVDSYWISKLCKVHFTKDTL